jgi:hypothetical protein
MNLQVDVDHQSYGEALAEFIRYHGTTLPKALRFEGRQLALRLVKFTPPKTLTWVHFKARGESGATRRTRRRVRCRCRK